MKDIALTYLRNGLSVIPAIKKEKRPSLRMWKDYQQRLPTEAEWQNWYADALCIICGEVSGNVLMIDFDQQGKVFEKFKAKVPADLFNRLVVETSQSGGRHIIFRTESPLGKSKKLAVDTDGQILIETRAEGSLFLCAPTPGYELIQGDFQNIPILQDHEVMLLWEIAIGFDQKKTAGETADSKRQPSANLQKVSQNQQATGTRPGDAFNNRGKNFIRNILQKHGWTCARPTDGNDERWRRPGSDRDSANLHNSPPTFHVFSSNAAPFNTRSHTYFEVYTILEHNGNFTAAAKELARQGFGDIFAPQPVELPEFIVTPPPHNTPPHGEDEDDDESDDEESDDAIDDDDCPETFPDLLLKVPGFVSELAQYINSAAHNDQPIYSLASALAFQALLCAQNVKDPTGIRTNPYIIVAGRSASGKDKGREIIKKIFTQLENTPAYKGDWYKPLKFFVEGVASEPALLRWLEANHGALLWLWDEMGKELATYSNDRNAFLAGIPTTLMRLYTSGDSIFIPHVRADTKNTIPPIQQPNLVLYGTAEKETLFKAFSVSALTDGLLGRFMIFEGNDSAKRYKQTEQLPIPESILETTHWWLKKRGSVINQSIPQPDIVPVTPEAEEVFDRFLNVLDDIQQQNDRIKDALWGRALQQARQFALIYACSVSKESPVIDTDAAQWAYELVTYLIKRKIYIAERHVADSEFDRQQKEVMRYIESRKGKCTHNEFTRKFQRLEKRRRDDIIANLKDAHVIKELRQKQKGSRQGSIFYALNKKKP